MSRRQVIERKKTIPAWVWVAVVGGLLFIGFTGFIVVNVMANAGKPSREELLPTPKEIEAKVIGMNEAEVLKYLGKPTYTGRDKWAYYSSSRDAVTGKVATFEIFFAEGIATRVNY